MIDEIQAENHFTRTQVEKLIHFVKEDTPPADLTDIEEKYDDKVLIKACVKHANVITKEPFTHESLLIDKKEYQLSEREKQQAFRDYNNDKKYFPYNRPSSYSLYYSRFPCNPNELLQNQRNYAMHHSISAMNLSTMNHQSNGYDKDTSHLNNSNYAAATASLYSSKSYASEMAYLKSKNSIECLSNKNGMTSGNTSAQSYSNVPFSTSTSNNLHHQLQQFPTTSSFADLQQQQQLQFQQQQHQQQQQQTGTIQNLKDVKITSFVSATQIVIPTNGDGQNSIGGQPPIVIQPGEKVYILKTPKGVYLRTPDKKYIALRDKSLEDSFMPVISSPITSQNVLRNQHESFTNTPSSFMQQQQQSDQNQVYPNEPYNNQDQNYASANNQNDQLYNNNNNNNNSMS